jgi:hypothetical protein
VTKSDKLLSQRAEHCDRTTAGILDTVGGAAQRNGCCASADSEDHQCARRDSFEALPLGLPRRESGYCRKRPKCLISFGAGEGIRTLDPNLGKNGQRYRFEIDRKPLRREVTVLASLAARQLLPRFRSSSFEVAFQGFLPFFLV